MHRSRSRQTLADAVTPNAPNSGEFGYAPPEQAAIPELWPKSPDFGRSNVVRRSESHSGTFGYVE